MFNYKTMGETRTVLISLLLLPLLLRAEELKPEASFAIGKELTIERRRG
jgi:hypothetical protein